MTITALLGAPREPLDRHEQFVAVLLTVFRGTGKYYDDYCRMERQLPEPLGTNIAFMEKMNHIRSRARIAFARVLEESFVNGLLQKWRGK
jgi:hypothetical protein